MVSAPSGHRLVPAVVATAFLILAPVAHAQQVGVKAGVNFASLTPEEDEDPDSSRRLGPVGGVWVRIAPSARVSFQVEGLFSEKGVKFEAPQIGPDASADIRIRYLEVPVLARADFGASGAAARAFVVGGAAPAFKLSARGKAVAAGEEQSRDIDDAVYAVDLGLVGGLGVEFGRARSRRATRTASATSTRTTTAMRTGSRTASSACSLASVSTNHRSASCRRQSLRPFPPRGCGKPGPTPKTPTPNTNV